MPAAFDARTGAEHRRGPPGGGCRLLREGETSMQSTYAGYQFYARNPTASLQRIASKPEVARETAYYRAHIGKVKTVDDLIKDKRLYAYALKTYGLEDAIPNRAFIRKVLTSDLTQPKSFANALTDPRYRALAAAFGFTTSGQLPTTAVAQDAGEEDETLGLYSSRNLVGTTQQADITYYQSHIGNVHSITDLTSDSRLYRIALQAYGLDPTTTSTKTITQLLEIDRFDPQSFVDQSGATGDGAQSLASIQAAVSRYAATVGTDAASQQGAAVETAYYRSAMADVHTVDQFLSDGRLVAYTAQAYGLAGSADAVRTYAEAHGVKSGVGMTAAETSDLLRSVLTSELTKPGNAADAIGGGFRDLAGALGFGAQRLQSAGDMADTVARYIQVLGGDASGQAASAESAYYKATVPTLTSPDQLAADPRLLAYVTTAFGLVFPAGSTAATQAATVSAALSGDPTNPSGTAARLGASFGALASAFNSAKPVYAQSASSAESTIDLYTQRTASDPAAASETDYYRATMPGVKSVDALLGDSRLLAYVVKAFDIAVPAGASEVDTRAHLRAVLTSDPVDPAGATAAGGTATRRLASAFRFDAAGTVSSPSRPEAATTGVQTAAAMQATGDLYAERLGPDPSQQAQGRIESDYSQAAIAAATTLDDVIGDPRVVDYLATAYDIGFKPTATDADRALAIRALLTSDPDNPKSAASQQGNSARALAAAFTFSRSYQGDAAIGRNGRPDLVAFADAFNFDKTGQVAPPRLAQPARDTAATLALYAKSTAAANRGKTSAQAEAAYFEASIGDVRTLGGFLSDARLEAVATAAYGVTRPAGLSDAAWTSRLTSVLTSDLADPKSTANTLGAGARKLAAAFAFAKDGCVSASPAQAAQSGKAAILMADPYAKDAMETEAGTNNPGVRLALYFTRLAPTVTDMYQILADKALLSVAKTALGLPDGFSKLNIDSQARMLAAKIKPSDLSDPKKLDLFVKRFAVLYDTAKLTNAPPSTIFDSMASGTDTTSNSLLSTLYNSHQSSDQSSVLQLFAQS